MYFTLVHVAVNRKCTASRTGISFLHPFQHPEMPRNGLVVLRSVFYPFPPFPRAWDAHYSCFCPSGTRRTPDSEREVSSKGQEARAEQDEVRFNFQGLETIVEAQIRRALSDLFRDLETTNQFIPVWVEGNGVIQYTPGILQFRKWDCTFIFWNEMDCHIGLPVLL
jgi:hypothetical protein